jgi:RND family efflux transporter MFP subunit
MEKMFVESRPFSHTGLYQFGALRPADRQFEQIDAVPPAPPVDGQRPLWGLSGLARIWTSFAGALLLSACGGSEPQPSAPHAVQGERITIRQSQVPQVKPLAAEISTRDQAEALARIPGTLVQLNVREGDEVTKGQLIGRVVDTRLGFETNAYAAQAAAAEAQAEAARAELSRIQYLYRQGVYAKARLDQAQAAARSAEAQVRAARSQQAASAAVTGQGSILAPANGRVLHANIPQGSVVAPGMSVATVTAGPPLLRLDVPESLARRLRKGAPVTIQDDSALSGRRGTIAQIYPAVSQGRVRVDVQMTGLTTDLVGRRVNVMIDVGSHPGVVIPRRFVATRFGIDYVDLVAKDGTASSVPVQTAPTSDPNQIELLSGATSGDTLIAVKNVQ